MVAHQPTVDIPPTLVGNCNLQIRLVFWLSADRPFIRFPWLVLLGLYSIFDRAVLPVDTKEKSQLRFFCYLKPSPQEL